MTTNRPLRVFLCHSSNEKPAVRELYQQLRAEPWIQPWLDEEELYPGADWNLEIEKAVEASDAILVCLTKASINKEGYVQRELRIVLGLADYKPEGTLFIIPVRLEECDPPRRLRAWQYADYFAGSRDRAFQRPLVSLKRRAEALELNLEKSLISGDTEKQTVEKRKPAREKKDNEPPTAKKPITKTPKTAPVLTSPNQITLSNGMELVCVPAGKFLMGTNEGYEDYEKPQHTVDIPYDYWVARYPVTNELHNAYAQAGGIEHPVDGWQTKKNHPVNHVEWIDTTAYCRWLNNLLKVELPGDLILRLPTEAEWEKGARGVDGREFPWGNEFDKHKCNASKGLFSFGDTTPVGLYSPQGDSPYGCADMSGNVFEWTNSLTKKYPYVSTDGREIGEAPGNRVARGGSFMTEQKSARCAYRYVYDIGIYIASIGFRVVAAPPLPK